MGGGLVFLLTSLVLSVVALPQPAGNPIANPKAQVLLANGTVRFTVLTPSLVRMESVTPNHDGTIPPFDDFQTTVVINRLFPVPQFTATTSGGVTTITTSSFILTYTYAGLGILDSSNLQVKLLSPRLWSNVTMWQPGDTPYGNLYGTFHTLDTLEGWHSLNCTFDNTQWEGPVQQPLLHCAWGLISKAGWAFVDDSRSPIFVDGWIKPQPGSCALTNTTNQQARVPCFGDPTINPGLYADACAGAGCCYAYLAQPPTPLNLFYAPSRYDYFSEATCAGCGNIYNFSSFQGYLFGDAGPEEQLGQRVLLNNYWKQRNPGGDNALSSSQPNQPGYNYVGPVGWAWAPNITQPANTWPLKLWYQAKVEDFFTTATPAEETMAKSGNYTFVELLGYIQQGTDPTNGPVNPAPAGPPSCYQPSGNSDWYLFTHGINYKQALADFAVLAGNIPIPRRHWLGMSWSRWGNSLTQNITYEQVQNLTMTGFPLSTYIFDMNWHLKPDWTGYTWDTVQYPNHVELLEWLHSLGLPIGANLHDMEGVMGFELRYPEMAEANGINPASNETVQFRISNKVYADSLSELVLEPLAEEGIDFWWTDWQQGEAYGVEDCYGLSPTFMLNHYRFINYTDSPRRGLIHSRWGGLGNHRYTSGFGGDVIQSWDSLQFMIYFTTTAANVLFGWWGHEMMQVQDAVPPTPAVNELFTRVMQFGAFSPIYTNWGNDGCPDNLWELPAEYLEGTRAGLMARAQLLPYRYTLARVAHDTAVSLLRPMYYDYPLEEDAYSALLQYMLGPELIVAPVNSPMDPSTELANVSVWFPDDDSVDFWVSYDDPSVQYPSSGEWQTLYYPLNRVPVFVKAGAIIPLVPYLEAQQIGSASQNYPSLEFVVYPSSPSTTSSYTWVYEDDGMSNDYLLSNNTFMNTSISFTKQSSTNKCDFFSASSKGSYNGMPDSRSYTIRLLATGATPLTVVINDIETPQSPCLYDTPLPGSWCTYLADPSPSPSSLSRSASSPSLSVAIGVADQPLTSPLNVMICWSSTQHIQVV